MKDLLTKFSKTWPRDSSIAKMRISENRKFNSDLAKVKSQGNRLTENKKSFSTKELEAFKLITRLLPTEIQKSASLPTARYKLKGSGGQGGVVNIPWICIFDKQVSRKASEGYYIVYLFKKDLSGFYLSLNQGYTKYKITFGQKQGRVQAQKNAIIAQKLLSTITSLDTSKITLGSNSELAKGYEAGNIASKYYSTVNIPSTSQLISDLQEFLAAYLELKTKIGRDILKIESALPEEEFQQVINEAQHEQLPDGKIQKPDLQEISGSLIYKRSPSRSKSALINANFQCEVSSEHQTFISKSSGNPFAEAHHLIPMEFQDKFDVSIDVPENIAALCPNCHRAIHLAGHEEQIRLINTLVTPKRLSQLKDRGIDKSVDHIIQYYVSQ